MGPHVAFILLLLSGTTNGQLYQCPNGAPSGSVANFIDANCDNPGLMAQIVPPDPAAFNASTCAQLCLQNSTCIGFQFWTSPNPQTCWPKSTTGITSASIEWISLPGYNLYLRAYCNVTAPTNGTASYVGSPYADGSPCFIGMCNVTYSCAAGFLMNGSAMSACIGNGTKVGVLSPPPPMCQPALFCPALAAPGNGSVSGGASATYLSTAAYACNQCFTLIGSMTNQCIQPVSGGALAWSIPHPPTCSGNPTPCTNIFDSTMGTISPALAFAGTYTFTCNAGYTMTPTAPGITTASYTCNCTGEWNLAFVTCQQSCTPLVVANGYVTRYSLQSLKAGTTAYWTCDEGYLPSGDPFVTCSAASAWTWIREEPTCQSGASVLGNVSSPLTPAEIAMLQSLLNASHDTTALSVTMANAFPFIMDQLTTTQLSQVSYTVQDLLLDCQFSGQSCKSTDVILGEQDPTFGNCYTFNHANMTPYVEFRSGEQQGLYLALNVQQEEYLSFTETAGMHIVIQDQGDLILPDVSGWDVMPGTATSLVIRLTTVSRHNTPVSMCISGVSGLPAGTPYYYPDAYAPEACLRSLTQQAHVKACGCASPYYALPPGNVAQLCNLTQIFCSETFIATQANQIAQQSNLQCPTACVQQQVDASRAFAVTSPLAATGYCSANPPNSSLTCAQFSRSNLILLRVFYQSLFHVGYTEYPALKMVDLFSIFGGMSLMFAGMSVISFVEVLAIILEIAGTFFKEKFTHICCGESDYPRKAQALLMIPSQQFSSAGTIEFLQRTAGGPIQISGQLKIPGIPDKLQRGFHIHELGIITPDCTAAGAHYNPFKQVHGSLDTSRPRHIGDLGNVPVDAAGNVKVDITIPNQDLVPLSGPYSVIGRSLVIHEDIDDLGRGSFPDSNTTGHAGARVACGVIGIASLNFD